MSASLLEKETWFTYTHIYFNSYFIAEPKIFHALFCSLLLPLCTFELFIPALKMHAGI